MILDSLANARLYLCVHPAFNAAFDYIEQFDPATPDGDYPLLDDGTFVRVQTYTTAPEADRKWESHLQFIDIQYVVAGREATRYAQVATLEGGTPYNQAKDVINYTRAGENVATLYVAEGHFVIFHPHDGHQPGIAIEPGERVRKVVVKVAVRRAAG